MTKYIYDRFVFTEKYRNELIELIKHQTNIEIGGYRDCAHWDSSTTVTGAHHRFSTSAPRVVNQLLGRWWILNRATREFDASDFDKT